MHRHDVCHVLDYYLAIRYIEHSVVVHHLLAAVFRW